MRSWLLCLYAHQAKAENRTRRTFGIRATAGFDRLGVGKSCQSACRRRDSRGRQGARRGLLLALWFESRNFEDIGRSKQGMVWEGKVETEDQAGWET